MLSKSRQGLPLLQTSVQGLSSTGLTTWTTTMDMVMSSSPSSNIHMSVRGMWMIAMMRFLL